MKVFFVFSDRILVYQTKVDRTYAALKDLAEERRLKLLERCDLFRLLQEITDLEQWIAQREVVASSMEAGQDFDHVVVSSLIITIQILSRGGFGVWLFSINQISNDCYRIVKSVFS